MRILIKFNLKTLTFFMTLILINVFHLSKYFYFKKYLNIILEKLNLRTLNLFIYERTIKH